MLIDHFVKMEKEHNLLARRYRDFSYWVYARYAVFSYLTKLEDGVETSSQEMTYGLAGGIRQMAKNSFGFYRRCRKMGQKDLLILNHERRVLEEGSYECIYTEKVEEHYKSSVMLERPYYYHHLTPIHTERILYSDYLDLKSLSYGFLQCRLHGKTYRNAKAFFEKELQEIVPVMQKWVKERVEIQKLAETITRLYLLYRSKKPAMEKVIDIIRPKMILEVVSYNLDCMIANEIAAKKGILTAELQHGVMSGSVAYRYPEGAEVTQFPDKLFLFSDYWKTCTAFPLASSDAVAVGYPYLDRKAAVYEEMAKRQGRTKKTVLFLSQWTIGEAFSKFAVAFARAAQGRFRIIYKLHPGEYAGWQKKYPWLLESGIEVIDSLEHNIYEYFAVSDVQVGVSSTAVFEGLVFGLETYVYNTVSAECLQPLCDSGYAVMVDSAEEMLACLTEPDTDKKKPSGDFWKRDAQKNLFGQIDKVLCGNG